MKFFKKNSQTQPPRNVQPPSYDETSTKEAEAPRPVSAPRAQTYPITPDRRADMPIPTCQAPQYSPAQLQQFGQQYENQLLGRCALGDHDWVTGFGLCGILAAIFCFPIGLICLCADTERKCARCGVRMI